MGDTWSVLILLSLGEAEMRFNQLKLRVDGVSQKMLSQTLRSLERDGLVDRRAFATVPVTVSYRVTPLGRDLLAALQLMIGWAEARMPDVEAARRAYDRAASAGAGSS